MPSEKRSCFVCKLIDPPAKTCGRCKRIYYCSLSCQKADWERHRPSCFSDDPLNIISDEFVKNWEILITSKDYKDVIKTFGPESCGVLCFNDGHLDLYDVSLPAIRKNYYLNRDQYLRDQFEALLLDKSCVPIVAIISTSKKEGECMCYVLRGPRC